MQYRPDAPTLLSAVADVLDEVLPDVPVDKQHRVRVAAHLTRLVEREVRSGPDAAAAERAAMAELLGEDVADVTERLAGAIRDSTEIDYERMWAALVEITRRDLEISKPGHSEWAGT